jgi:hypothetical protein
MKKILITLSIGITSFAAYSNGANAQYSSSPVDFINSKVFKQYLRYVAALETPLNLGAFMPDAKKNNARAIKDFQTRFGAETEARWYVNENGFESYFVKDGYGDRACYDKKGRWLYSLIFYNEDKLPRDIRTAVKSIYFDMAITLVEEVQCPDGMVYIIHLEDKSNIKTLKVSKDGEIEIMQELTKQ